MKKLRLELDALQVQTFDPSGAAPGTRGTVRGHDTVNEAYTDGPGTAWWQCFTLTCICGASEKELCSAGCPAQQEIDA